ncbi:MAG: hypothetical protein Fur006_07120 [Coleofasciculaceae cyanobacterium]
MNTKSLYIQILEQCWMSAGVKERTTLTPGQESSTKPESENQTPNNQIQINEAIRHTKHIYYLERRLFL